MALVQKVLTDEGRKIFQHFLKTNSKLTVQQRKEESLMLTQPDEKITFRQLNSKQKHNCFDESEEISQVNEAENFLAEVKKNLDSRIY